MSQMGHDEAPSAERSVLAAVRRGVSLAALPQAAYWFGLDRSECTELLARAPVEVPTGVRLARTGPPLRLLTPLVALSWAHRTSDAAPTRLMAGAVACGCFGERHLWQDLGLSARNDVSVLLPCHLAALAAANTRLLRWKRYLFLRLGEERGVRHLAPPCCDGCDDFHLCFPPPGDGISGIPIRSIDSGDSKEEGPH